ncbi:D-alanyl-D-alanine carboxypeptidase family protein [Brunnivagina elsteri]|uniref:Peptidase M15 n=1 Tax=Brunnivagina elsteri CCALA 953 TaxID=987040 RepID=A0A2A2TG59_9CYAN|nr:D-alanyl-D-alanine carboxypeptidase family protein [Calothrix elsteri]PAX52409.1 peptidase M15 [Calothrix elsteri CCALA 953]
MNRIIRRMIVMCACIFISAGIVASSSNAQHIANFDSVTPTEDCLINQTMNKPCISKPVITNPQVSPNTIPTYNPNLPEKERFISAITSKLPVIPIQGTFEYILLRQYGAVFINKNPLIKLPPKVLFPNSQETKQYQTTLTMGKVNTGNNCYLQKAAADALNKSRTQSNISLKSGNGGGDCTRTFETNLRFWRKYANNNTLEQVRQGKETRILSVVAPPGTSQHLWGLAADLRVSNSKQRQVLNQNGWFQTVEGDVPHWTYLGVSEENLNQLGFREKIVGNIPYWLIPL